MSIPAVLMPFALLPLVGDGAQNAAAEFTPQALDWETPVGFGVGEVRSSGSGAGLPFWLPRHGHSVAGHAAAISPAPSIYAWPLLPLAGGDTPAPWKMPETGHNHYTPQPVPAVPLPGSVWLMMSGLAALLWLRRRA